jgi:hypothetical protein
VRGQIAAIHVTDKIFHAALILGLARIGVVTMSARSRSFPQEIGVDAVIADANAAYQNAKRVIVAEAGAWMANGDGAPLDDPRLVSAGGDDPCRITLTSGSTADTRRATCQSPFECKGILECKGAVWGRVGV